MRRRPTHLVPLFVYLARLRWRTSLGVGLTLALLATGLSWESRPRPRLAAPDLSTMGPNLVSAWRDDATHRIRAGARTAGRWVIGPVDLGPAARHSRPRLATTERRAAVAWSRGRTLHLVTLDRQGVQGRARVSLGTFPSHGLSLRALGSGWVLLWNDAGQIKMQRYDHQARPRGAARDVARGHTFDAIVRPGDEGTEVHLFVYERRGVQHVRLRPNGRLITRELLDDDPAPRRVTLSRSIELGAVEQYSDRLCLRAGSRTCARRSVVGADLAPLGSAWLVVYADESGVHSAQANETLGEGRIIDARGSAPRIVSAGEGIYAAMWEHEGYLRAAMLNEAGEVKLFKDLAP